MDDNGVCIADAGGYAEALAYLRELKNAGVRFATSGAEAQELFRAGQVAAVIDGSWLLADYGAALGERLGVAPMPAGPSSWATPMLGATGVYLNRSTERPDAALNVALALTDAETQQQLAQQPTFLPSNAAVTPPGALQQRLLEAASGGVPRPQRVELDGFWRPFDRAVASALDTDADPAAIVQEACALMNQLNLK
jgi:arabinogalactan oligomer / maltooligosaccharide transport system substrate-binding protein